MYNFIFVIFDTKKEGLSSWLNVGYLTSSLRKIPEIEVKHCFFEMQDVDRAINEVLEMHPDFVGLPLLQENHKACLRFIKEIKTYDINIRTIIGNVDATVYSEYIMQHSPMVDYIVKGEGEETIYDLCRLLVKNKSVDDCKGIVYRKENHIVENKNRKQIHNLDTIEMPDRSYLGKRTNTVPIIGARGCVGFCTFCNANTINCDYKLRVRSVDNIMSEVRFLVEQKKCIHIEFVDSVFLGGDIQRIEEFYQKMKCSNIKATFNFNLTCELIDIKMTELLILLSEIGLEYIYLGIESGNEQDLKLYGKRATINDNIHAVKTLHKLGIPFMYGFICFNPYSTVETLKQNVDFIVNTNLAVNLSILARNMWIFGGTPILKKIKHDGLLQQEINEPIYNVANYKYKEKTVQSIQESTQKLWGFMELDRDPIDYLLLYKRYAHFIDKESQMEYKIYSFMDYVSKSHIYLFSELLDCCRKDKEDEYIYKKAKDIKNITLEMKKEIVPSINRMVKKLISIGQFNIT